MVSDHPIQGPHEVLEVVSGEALNHSGREILGNISRKFTESYQLDDLVDLVTSVDESVDDTRASNILYSLDVCLESSHPQGDDEAGVQKIANFATSFLRLPSARKHDARDVLSAESALRILIYLSNEFGYVLSQVPLIWIVLCTGFFYTQAETNVSALATKLLESQLPGSKKPDFIVGTILRDVIQPSFSKKSLGQRSKITEPKVTSRTVMVLDLEENQSLLQDRDHFALLSWAVTESDAHTLQHHWPSFTPPILTLLESPTTSIRLHGLHTALEFIKRCPSHVLCDTGLGDVLEDALTPTLQFLPTLTPEKESAQLLEPTYNALIQLTRTKVASKTASPLKRNQAMDKLLRQGVLMGYAHAAEYPEIVRVLLIKTRDIVLEMGIRACRHLKDLFPLYAAVATDPFALSHPECVLAALAALEATILNCWPRIEAAYVNDSIAIIVLCWQSIQDEPSEGRSSSWKRSIEELEGVLSRLGKLVTGVMRDARNDHGEALAKLALLEPGVAQLFSVHGPT